MMKHRVLIVEDHSIEALNLQRMLEKDGYIVSGVARSVELALQLIEKDKPDIVILDIFLKGLFTGIDLAYQLKEWGIAFIYLSANSNRETLSAANATDPYGFLVKPVREKDVLVMLEIARYKHQQMNLQGKEISNHKNVLSAFDSKNKTITKQSTSFHGIIGQSQALMETLTHLQLVAPTESTVLILGESGTGKERIAQCLHELSQRKNGPFVKINCGALPATLIESILFGHEKGAFTGAIERNIGKFEQAENGTLFLDEIGELPLELQVKLLRALHEKEIERLGGKQTIKLNVRIVAATNRDLEKDVAEGRFRLDLFYRLNVFPLHLPPLRERKEDISLLVTHFLTTFGEKYSKPGLKLSPKLAKDFQSYNWPGNIRELEHLLERGVLLASTDTVEQIEIPKVLERQTIKKTEPFAVKTIDENERDYILGILKHCKGRVSGKGGAAELLGVPPSTLHSKMKRLGIKTEYIF